MTITYENLEFAMFAFFAFTNVCLNVTMIIYLFRINRGIRETLSHHSDFADAMCRIDHVSNENAVAISERIAESITDVNKRIEFLTRWQKVTAKMIKDDIDRLKEHDSKVGGISNVIDRIRERVEPYEKKD